MFVIKKRCICTVPYIQSHQKPHILLNESEQLSRLEINQVMTDVRVSSTHRQEVWPKLQQTLWLLSPPGLMCSRWFLEHNKELVNTLNSTLNCKNPPSFSKHWLIQFEKKQNLISTC